jgi:FkbM family methyltransferase
MLRIGGSFAFVGGKMARNEQLVYDLGLHKGEDTEFYLKKGYQVVAFEANPNLAEFCCGRFAQELRSGQLQIVRGAIAAPTSTGKVTFYLNNTTSEWGTVDRAWVARNAAQGSDSSEIEVDQIDMAEIFEKFGIPFYLKIDIEGADGLVLDALRSFEDRPQFISLEANTVDVSALIQDLKTLSHLGYKQFQLVPQGNIGGTLVHSKTLQDEPIVHVFAVGASGVFGDELTGVWIDRDAVITSFSPPFNKWQDIHANLSADELTNVALNCPATQSSTSRWSTEPEPDVDARVANNGDVVSESFFHTGMEVGPWWQVDLGELFFVDKIVLYNRNDVMDRLERFTVFGSEDGRQWVPIHKKSDDSHFRVFAANITGKEAVRFVRLRLDGHNFLHFRELQIFGRRAAGSVRANLL